MSQTSVSKPVILVTHSRSCSTVIERIFWAHDDIRCYHEHFGDAFYFGPEKVSENWKHWPADRITKTGKSHVTYKIALEDILSASKSNRYVFDKDMSYHIVPPKDNDLREIPSLRNWDKGAAGVRQNPTWLPTSAIHSFSFAFLIRSPWLAVPSLYRLHTPPAVHETMEPNFKPAEIGYREMRVLIEYLYPQTQCDTHDSNDDICFSDYNETARPVLVDASDVLATPEKLMGELCSRVGLPFSTSMLSWEAHNPAMEKEMSKFPGFHTDAISSSGLRRRTKDEEDRERIRGMAREPTETHHQKNSGMEMSEEEYMTEWTNRYGEQGAGKILETVRLCVKDYIWLRRWTIRP